MAKNPAAVELGRLGGQVTGVSKGTAALTPEEMKERSRKMLEARWGEKGGQAGGEKGALRR